MGEVDSLQFPGIAWEQLHTDRVEVSETPVIGKLSANSVLSPRIQITVEGFPNDFSIN